MKESDIDLDVMLTTAAHAANCVPPIWNATLRFYQATMVASDAVILELPKNPEFKLNVEKAIADFSDIAGTLGLVLRHIEHRVQIVNEQQRKQQTKDE